MLVLDAALRLGVAPGARKGARRRRCRRRCCCRRRRRRRRRRLSLFRRRVRAAAGLGVYSVAGADVARRVGDEPAVFCGVFFLKRKKVSVSLSFLSVLLYQTNRKKSTHSPVSVLSHSFVEVDKESGASLPSRPGNSLFCFCFERRKKMKKEVKFFVLVKAHLVFFSRFSKAKKKSNCRRRFFFFCFLRLSPLSFVSCFSYRDRCL